MLTQTLTQHLAPIVELLQCVADKIPIVAVMTASDAVGKLSFTPDLVMALRRQGKRTYLINADDKPIDLNLFTTADIIVVDCPCGCSDTVVAMADFAAMVILTLAADDGETEVSNTTKLLCFIADRSHYHKDVKVVVTHALNGQDAQRVFNQLEQSTKPIKDLTIHQLCTLYQDPLADVQQVIFNQAATSLVCRLF